MKHLKPIAFAAALMATGGTVKAAEPVFTGQSPHMYPGYITENLTETRDFFVQKLGFTQLFESEWFALLKLEGNQIGLMKPEQAGQAAIFRTAYSGNGAWITFDMQGKSIDAAAKLPEAVARMAKTGKHCLLVQEGEKPVGIISEHDVVVAFSRLGPAAKIAKVKDYMTIDVVAARLTLPVEGNHLVRLGIVHLQQRLDPLPQRGIVDRPQEIVGVEEGHLGRRGARHERHAG